MRTRTAFVHGETGVSPADNAGEMQNVQGLFYMRIVDFSTQTEARGKIVKENPGSLTETTG